MKTRVAGIAIFVLSGLLASTAAAETSEPPETGLIVVQSARDLPTTAARFAAAVEDRGLAVFSRIDHAAGAQRAGLELLPTELIIFGSPKVGTALMQCDRRSAIDLPLKALIWEDRDGDVWLAYNDTGWLAARHDLKDCAAVLAKVEKALAGFAAQATADADPSSGRQGAD